MAKQTSSRQIELMLNFLEQHRDLALGRVRGKEGNALSTRLWAKCTEILNRDMEGVQKTPNEWKRYYNCYKSRIKAKQRAIKCGMRKTGGSPSEFAEMTPLEERLIGIIGGCSSPPPVRHDPLDGLTIETTQGHVQEVKYIKEEPEYVEILKEKSADYNLLVPKNNSSFEVPLQDTLTESQVSQTYGEDVKVEENVPATSNARDNQVRPTKRRKRHSLPPKKSAYTETESTLREIEMTRIAAEREIAQSRIEVDREIAQSRIEAEREIAQSRIQADREIAQAQVEALNTLSSSIKDIAGTFTLGFQMIADILSKDKRPSLRQGLALWSAQDASVGSAWKADARHSEISGVALQSTDGFLSATALGLARFAILCNIQQILTISDL